MQANNMKYSFLLKFDSMFEFSAPAYDDRQISFVLNQAQRRVFIDTYYSPKNRLGGGFEIDEKHRRDLEQLIKSASISTGEISLSTNQTGVHPNGKFYDLPSGFLYAIEEAGKLGALEPEITVKPIKHDAYLANIRNPYKKPCSGLIWRMDYSRNVDPIGEEDASSKRVELITDGTTLTDYRVRYLRMPPDIIVDEVNPENQISCVLDEIVQFAIIDEAVKIAVAAVKPEEYQIASAEKGNN